ncbi:MAG: hypothetical protein M1453_07850 [Acidobacteria bacterium]|nr:hypothetical protein [Acidobacteriota bacterium]MCL5287889.1 hypothetical protein [Acidobacteriota bacterium]
MRTDLKTNPTVNKKIIETIVSFGELYKREFLIKRPEFQKKSLERDWWSGLRLFLNHSFYQGRRDEVSTKVEAKAMPVLSRYFENRSADRLSATDFGRLARDLRGVIGKGKIGKGRDVEMLVDIFRFVSELQEKNLAHHSVRRIRDGRLKEHCEELQNIEQIGPKIATFYLRDLVCIYDLEDRVRPQDLQFLQPMDVWVRKVAHTLGITSSENPPGHDPQSGIIEACRRCKVSALKFNQGAWYLGKHAFEILVKHLDKVEPET